MRLRTLSANTQENAQAAWEKLIRNKRRFRYTVIGGVIALIVVVLAAIVVSLNAPASIHQLTQRQNSQQQRLNRITAPKFPVGAVEFDARAAVSECVNYTDQAPATQVARVQTHCGWNGAGVANMAELDFNGKEALRTPLTRDGFSGLPYEARFLGSSRWLRYWVPVQQHGSGARVAGMPVPLNAQPTFVLNGCSADTSRSANASVQVIQQLVKEVPRQAMPGMTIKFNGNGLTGAHADSVQLCQSQAGVNTLIAKVTYNGPTTGAQLSVWYGFRTQVISTGETRVSGVGLFAGQPPGA